MKTLQEHLGQIILAIAAVALIAGVVVCLATPVGDTISAIFNKTQEQGTGNIWDKGEYEIPYTVKLKANIAEAGTVEFTSDGHNGTSLSLKGENTLTFKATANTGYQFLGWYVGDTLLSEDAEYTTTVNGATTIVGHFAQAFGLYKTGTNYTELKYTWEELIDNGYITVTDGAITGSNISYTAGDLLLPTDGSITSIGSSAFRNCGLLNSIELPASVTSIGSSAFYGTSLASVIIPEDVTEIASYAFSFCQSLTNIEIPNSVTSIGEGAFNQCTSLTSVTFGENSQLTTIGTRAFGNCTGLTSIKIPASVKSIDSEAFSGCTSLINITVDAENTKYHSAGNCIIETASKTLVVGCTGSVIPTDGSVTSIGQYAFYGCKGLTSIELPASVTSIGSSAFYGTSLANVTFGENSQLTSIGLQAFSGCTNLTNVTFGENSQLTSIGTYAFKNCTSLTSIQIPASVTTINQEAFNRCTGLANITFAGTVGQWNAITFGRNWNTNVPATEVICSDGTVSLS